MSERQGARSVEQATMRERSRIADALHDDVLQRAATARQDLLELQRASEPSALVDGALQSVSETIDAIRTVLAANHDLLLSNMPLPVALTQVAQDAARRGRLGLELHLDPAASLEAHRSLVVSALRELSENVVRHASAKTLTVSADSDRHVCRLVVSDDGGGIPDGDVERCARPHVGLARLTLQARRAGGHLEVTSSARGTTVALLLPLRDTADQRAADQMATAICALRDAGVAWSILRRDGTYAFVDDHACALVGYTREEIQSHGVLGPPWSVLPERLGENLKIAEQLGTSTFLTTIRTKQGEDVEVTCTFRAITRDGDPAFLAVTRPLDEG